MPVGTELKAAWHGSGSRPLPYLWEHPMKSGGMGNDPKAAGMSDSINEIFETRIQACRYRGILDRRHQD